MAIFKESVVNPNRGDSGNASAVLNKAMKDNSAIQNQRWKEIQEAQNPYVPPTGGGGGGNVAPFQQSYDYSGLVSALAQMNNNKYNALKEALLAGRQRADDMANMNYQRNLRQWKKTYNGNAGRLNGAGLSNKFNLMASRDSAIRQNETDYLNNLATVQSGRYDDASSLLRGLNNPDQNTINALLKYYM